VIVLASACPALITVLLVAAVGKARDVRGFAATIDGYRILPRRLTTLAAVLVLAAEVGSALLQVAPATRRWGGLVSVALFAVFLIAMASVLRRGLDIDCGCFGARPSPVSPVTMVRTGLLLLLAVMTVIAGPAPFHRVHLLLSAVFLGLIGAVTRLGHARISSHDDSSHARGPRPGMRFALAAPLETAAGPTLFVLVSPACGACTAMLPTFLSTATKTRVVLVSAAEEETVRAYLSAHGIDLPLLIDPDVYDANDIPWPPYAVITDAAGTVLAAGGADSPRRLDVLFLRSRDLHTA
jgi:hypothetical protein